MRRSPRTAMAMLALAICLLLPGTSRAALQLQEMGAALALPLLTDDVSGGETVTYTTITNGSTENLTLAINVLNGDPGEALALGLLLLPRDGPRDHALPLRARWRGPEQGLLRVQHDRRELDQPAGAAERYAHGVSAVGNGHHVRRHRAERTHRLEERALRRSDRHRLRAGHGLLAARDLLPGQRPLRPGRRHAVPLRQQGVLLLPRRPGVELPGAGGGQRHRRPGALHAGRQDGTGAHHGRSEGRLLQRRRAAP